MKNSQCSSVKFTPRERILYSMAAVCIISANAAIYIGLFLPPQGEIDSSILGYFGLVCAFSAALFGITADFRSTMMSFKTTPPESSEKQAPTSGLLPSKEKGKEVTA